MDRTHRRKTEFTVMKSKQATKPVISAIVLAAGSSRRFGATKLTQELHGKPLLQHALIAAQGISPGAVTLVVGHDRDAIIAAAADLGDNIILNDDYRDGIGSSIAIGVNARRNDSDAILILLGDQPRINASHLNDLVDAWSGADDEIVASSFDDVLGPPILFPSKAFDALRQLSGDAGAKQLLSNDEFTVRPVKSPLARYDVDTPEDLRRLHQR